MPLSLKIYNDAALSSVLPKLTALQRTDGATGPVDFVFYLGSTVSGKRFQAASNPGVDNILISVADSNPVGGQGVGAIKLAASSAGLDSAVAGAALDLGSEILSGASNAVEVHVRVEATDLTEGTYTDLSLQTNNLVESYA
ncbi:hypothetical protein DET64_105240 [Marinobacter nauticus]|uniref:Uncharacterized protein n=1 Tax=Marinobacter nauticus TaxID=2743 RepID=A0A368V232_MARNT|nr:hypothetical protein DET64_105240 [Marinobacter nauticus]RCW34863.1 hypothetical protein DET51_105239 [Marinobacter nauticus]